MKKKILLFTMLYLLALQNFSQHFPVDYSSGQGEPYSVIIQSITGITLDVNDEIVIIDANSFGNAGVAIITASTTFPIVINTYLQTTIGATTIPGPIPGNPITIKIWDASEGVEYDAVATFGSSSNGTFGNGFACQVTELNVTLSTQLTVDVASVEAFPNSTVSIDISFDNPDNIIIEGITVTILFDNTLTLGTPSFVNDATNFTTSNYDFIINDLLSDRIIIVCAYNGNGSPFSGSGKFGTFHLNVPASALVGHVYNLTLGATQINELPNADVTLNNGSITVKQNLFSIQGNVATHAGTPVSNATMTLTGTETKTAISNPNYSFTDLLLGEWTMVVDKTDDLNGVSAYDGSKGLQYLAGLISFTPYQLISFDVTGDGTVSALDASQILQYVASLITSFDAGKDWVFVAEPLSGTYTNEYIVPVFSETKTYTPLDIDKPSEQWIAVRLGDITGNWSSLSNKKSGMISKSEHLIEVQKGEIVKFVISSNEYLTFEGVDANSSYDEKYLKLVNAYTPLAGNYLTKYKSEKIAIASSGNSASGDGEFLVIEFEAIQSGVTSVIMENIQVNEQDINYTLSINGTTVIDNNAEYIDMQIYPNPCSTFATMSFPVTKAGEVSIKVYDISGKIIVDEQITNLSVGQHEYILNTNTLKEGVYFCKIAMPSNSVTKKLVVSK